MKIFTCLLCLLPLLAEAIDPQCSVQAGVGYRADFLDWSSKEIAIPLKNAHSNVRLDNQQIALFVMSARCSPCSWLYIRAEADYGGICYGSDHETFSFDSNYPITSGSYLSATCSRRSSSASNSSSSPSSSSPFLSSSPSSNSSPSSSSSSISSSSDTSCSNREIHLKSHHAIEGQWVADGNVAIGFPFFFSCTPLELIPSGGFSVQTQHIRSCITGGRLKGIPEFLRHEIDEQQPRRGKYQATWWGPWVGCEYELNTYDFWNTYGAFEYHFARCHRKRTTTLGITALDITQRTSQAYGTVVRWGTRYFFDCYTLASVEICYRYFSCKELNEHLAWRSLAMTVNLGYGF